MCARPPRVKRDLSKCERTRIARNRRHAQNCLLSHALSVFSPVSSPRRVAPSRVRPDGTPQDGSTFAPTYAPTVALEVVEMI